MNLDRAQIGLKLTLDYLHICINRENYPLIRDIIYLAMQRGVYLGTGRVEVDAKGATSSPMPFGETAGSPARNLLDDVDEIQRELRTGRVDVSYKWKLGKSSEKKLEGLRKIIFDAPKNGARGLKLSAPERKVLERVGETLGVAN